MIDTVYRVDHDAATGLDADSAEGIAAEEKVTEGKGIIEKISKLKYDMARDRPLEYVALYLELSSSKLKP